VKKKMLRVLGVFITLALMLTALPASIASAATVSSLVIKNIQGNATNNTYYNKSEGVKGDNFSVTLTGSQAHRFSLFFSSQKAKVGDDIDTEVKAYKEWVGILSTSPGDSAFVNTLTIPSSLTDGADKLHTMHGGTYYLYVTEYTPASGVVEESKGTKILYVTEFYMHGIASASIDTTSGFVGDEVVISGTGFAKDEALIVTFAGRDITSEIGEPWTGIDGSFNLELLVPDAVNGEQKVKVTGEDSQATFEFKYTVKASLSITPDVCQAGTLLTIKGTGFDYRSGVNFFLNGTIISPTEITWLVDSTYKRTNNFGSFTVTYVIPETTLPGSYAIKAEDSNKSSINYTGHFEILLNSVIELSKNKGNVGDTITVNGNTFTSGSTVTILFDGVSVGTATVSTSGKFTKDIIIPESTCNVHSIKVGNVEKSFTVEPKLNINKTEGIGGMKITVEGNGFAASTNIGLEFGDNDIDINGGDVTTGAKGSFSLNFIVPAKSPGKYDVTVTAGSVKSVEFNIVEPSVTLDVNQGEVGDMIIVTGSYFAAGKKATLMIGDNKVNEALVDGDGSFAAGFIIPSIAGGEQTLIISDGTTAKVVKFTVNASATISPTGGNVGNQVTIKGEGFTPNKSVTITYNGAALQSSTPIVVGSAGNFNVAFIIPASHGGENAIGVTDSIASVELTFDMETTPPPAPALTSPLSTTKQKGIVTFEWGAVSDLSLPITYTLQIATDSNFNSKVIERNLSNTTYTLTDAEKLAKLADNGHYYWRVIATDAAGNASSPSAVNTFVVGGGFPAWLTWLWVGLGVVVVFIFAVWLGRRMAYSSY